MLHVRGSRVVVLTGLAAATLALANCGRVVMFAANIPASFGSFERHPDIAYGANARARLDVYSHQHGRPRPVVIFWHGGMWIRGSKTDFRFVGAALARAGYVAVLPDYRLYPEVRFPAFVQDGASAVRWVHDHIAEYGGDPNAIFLMGHSAGAHIAAMIALEDQYLRAVGGDIQWIRGVIGVSGPYAMEADMSPASAGTCGLWPRCVQLLSSIFSASHPPPDERRPMAAGDSAPPPALLLHGARDTLVPVRHSEMLRDRLAARGSAVELRIYPDKGHSDILTAFLLPSLAGAAVMDVCRFIDAHIQAPLSCPPWRGSL